MRILLAGGKKRLLVVHHRRTRPRCMASHRNNDDPRHRHPLDCGSKSIPDQLHWPRKLDAHPRDDIRNSVCMDRRAGFPALAPKQPRVLVGRTFRPQSSRASLGGWIAAKPHLRGVGRMHRTAAHPRAASPDYTPTPWCHCRRRRDALHFEIGPRKSWAQSFPSTGGFGRARPCS